MEQQNTFWTSCPSCRAKFKYHIEFVNRFLVCQVCRNAFEARELPDGVNPEPLRKETQKAGSFIDLTADDGTLTDSDEEVRVLRFKPSNIAFGKRKRNDVEGSSSNSERPPPSFACEICIETKSVHESFGIKNCSHVYCTDCVVKYVDSKLQENIASIGCPVPGCIYGSLDPDYCHSILKPEVFEKWVARLCEDLIIESQKFYCPFKDCSAMLIDDGTEVVRESECHNCKRLFCAQCKVPWHAGITCPEFKRMNKDDIRMEKLAYKKHWRKCPGCGIYVERRGGCSMIHCRCGTYFSFDCERTGCTSCANRKRTKNGETMGYFVFLEEYRRIHRSYSKATIELVIQKWRSMSRSEKKPYENPAMKPIRIMMEPR